MSLTRLQNLLKKQSLILSIYKDKLEILNFLLWGYNGNIDILNSNGFLHKTAHIYYRTLIVELCALFDNHKYQANNFHQLTDVSKKYHLEIKESAKSDIQNILNEISLILSDDLKQLRNEEISHITLKGEAKLRFAFDHIHELNYCLELGSKIIKITGQGFIDISKNMDFQIGIPNVDLRSLQSLLFKVNGFNYEEAWKFEKL